jgi:hypothetical protein
MTLDSYVKNRQYVVSTAYWKNSFVITTKKLLASKAQPVRTCYSF